MNGKAQAKVSVGQKAALAPKTLNNVDGQTAKANVSDMEVFGDVNMFKVLCKASSKAQGWMKSTKAMEIFSLGVVVQTTTQQRNADGTNSIAESLVFVPGTKLIEEKNDSGQVVARKIQHL